MAFDVNPNIYNYGNPIQSLMQGLQLGMMPAQMRQDAQTNALKNAILQSEAQYAPQISQAQLQGQQLQNQYQKLQNQYYPQIFQQKTEPTSEYYQLVKQFNSMPNSPMKDQLGKRIDFLTTRGNGTTVYDPTTGNPLVTMGGTPISPPKLSTGEMPYYKVDDTGKPILDDKGNTIQAGIMRPASPKELQEMQGRYIFQNLYPKLNSILSHYSGKDSWTKFKNDLDNMQNNPQAKQNIIDFYTAQKLLPAVIAKEQQTLGASNTLGQFRALAEKMNSSDIPKLLEQYAGFTMPSDVMNQAGKNMVDTLTEITQGSLNVPGYIKVPFEAANETKKSTSNAEKDPFADYPVINNG